MQLLRLNEMDNMRIGTGMLYNYLLLQLLHTVSHFLAPKGYD